jgi:hypothetical protein
MHALHLPPRHLWRAAALALVLAFAMALMATDLNRLDFSLSTGGGSSAEVTTPPAGTPSWVRDPLSPPTVALTRAGG